MIYGCDPFRRTVARKQISYIMRGFVINGVEGNLPAGNPVHVVQDDSVFLNEAVGFGHTTCSITKSLFYFPQKLDYSDRGS